jgi:hypothetical protein
LEETIVYFGLGAVVLVLICLAVGYSIAEGAANRRRGRELERMKRRAERGSE